MRRYRGAAVGWLLLAAGIAQAQTPPPVPSPATGDELEATRRLCVTAARSAQQHEQRVAALLHDIALRTKSAAGAQRGLEETRKEQARFLATVLRIAHDPPGPPMLASAQPVPRRRAEMLIQATLPALRITGHALASEVQRLTALRRDIATETAEVETARTALDKDRTALASLVTRRRDAARKALREDPNADVRITKLASEAKDLSDLIKRAEAATERRDKDILAKARAGVARSAAAALTAESADPTRPRELPVFDPPQTALLAPVGGAVVRVFESRDASGERRNAIGLGAPSGGTVIAPFAGRVIYVGSFRDLGLILIMRHDGLYYSVLAGLGRADTRVDDWLVAGEPVGAMPAANDKTADKSAGDVLNLEVRREGRPIDPQPWLASNTAEVPQPEAGGDKAEQKGSE